MKDGWLIVYLSVCSGIMADDVRRSERQPPLIPLSLFIDPGGNSVETRWDEQDSQLSISQSLSVLLNIPLTPKNTKKSKKYVEIKQI